jgi:predicted acyl esterase
MFKRHPDRDPYWDDKRADFSKIKVPAYILGSYSTNLHTLGALRAYDEIPHKQKWYFSQQEIHNSFLHD